MKDKDFEALLQEWHASNTLESELDSLWGAFKNRAEAAGLMPPTETKPPIIEVVIGWVMREGKRVLEVLKQMGEVTFGEVQYQSPAPVSARIRGPAAEVVGMEYELRDIICPIHTENADIKLEVQPLDEEFNITLTLTSPNQPEQWIANCKVRWLINNEQQDEVTTLNDGLAPFHVSYGEHEFRCNLEEVEEEIVVKVVVKTKEN